MFSADGASPRLRNKLGLWTSSLKPAEWSTVASTTLQHLEVYIRQDNGQYKVYREQGSRHKPHVTPAEVCIDRLPSGTVPATLGPALKNGSRRVIFRARANELAQQTNAACTFAEFVAAQEPHIADILLLSDLSDDMARSVSELVGIPDLCSATDGGLMNGGGTFGFLWGSEDCNKIRRTGSGHVPGNAVTMSSTRAELCGIFASLTYLRLVTQYFHLVTPRETLCTLYCDSTAALQRVKALTYSGFGTTWRCRANYDLEAAIRTCLELHPVTVKWSWIKGHPGRRKKPENFTWAEKLNDVADDLATSARDHALTSTSSHWPEQQVSVIISSGRLCGRLSTEIRYCCTAPDLANYWRTRYDWTASQGRLIDTLGTAAAVSKLRPAAARQIQKLRCGWLPVNNRKSR